MKFLKRIFYLVLIVALAAGAGGWWIYRQVIEPYRGYDEAEVFVDIPSGSGPARIGERLAAAGVPDHPGYAAWIATYADPEFQALAAWARELCDTAAGDAGDGARARMHAAFRTCSEHELAFWEAAWKTGSVAS